MEHRKLVESFDDRIEKFDKLHIGRIFRKVYGPE